MGEISRRVADDSAWLIVILLSSTSHPPSHFNISLCSSFFYISAACPAYNFSTNITLRQVSVLIVHVATVIAFVIGDFS